MVPLIAVPSRFTEAADSWRVPATALGRPYQEAIVRAGAVPVAVPPLFGADPAAATGGAEAVLSRVHALCLPGGPDVDPRRYGATTVHERVYGVRAEHDALDLALARVAVARRLPVLAICRGHQVLNVALGGTLHQHLADEIGEQAAATHSRNLHEIKIDEGTRTAAAMGTQTPSCHCVHHQAIDDVAAGLTVTAWCDGVIEGVEGVDPDHWLVGVQWHPEDTAHDDPQQQALFDALVAAAAGDR